jgi:hypothetical protein
LQQSRSEREKRGLQSALSALSVAVTAWPGAQASADFCFNLNGMNRSPRGHDVLKNVYRITAPWLASPASAANNSIDTCIG